MKRRWLYPGMLALFVVGGAMGWIGAEVRRPPKQETMAVTIADLRSNPDRYAGKLVRLGGQLDECWGWECSLCPSEMTTQTGDAARCLPLEFRALMPGTAFGSHEQEDVFRFSDVVLEAKFDPTCWKMPCPDRQVVLYDAEISSVGTRRHSRSGLWLGQASPLIDMAEPAATEVFKAAYAAGLPKGVPVKAFATQDDGIDIVCWASLGDEPVWPTSMEGALSAKSKSDFYWCGKFRKLDHQWVAQVYD